MVATSAQNRFGDGLDLGFHYHIDKHLRMKQVRRFVPRYTCEGSSQSPSVAGFGVACRDAFGSNAEAVGRIDERVDPFFAAVEAQAVEGRVTSVESKIATSDRSLALSKYQSDTSKPSASCCRRTRHQLKRRRQQCVGSGTNERLRSLARGFDGPSVGRGVEGAFDLEIATFNARNVSSIQIGERCLNEYHWLDVPVDGRRPRLGARRAVRLFGIAGRHEGADQPVHGTPLEHHSCTQ